jgi:hypothetical protein
MLSEGEYVVPADVLRYYGVKFFEDLRSQAKMGLADMEQNGRIGGEPVMDDLPFGDEELSVMESDEEPVQMNRGGAVGFAPGGMTETQPTAFSTSSFQQDPNNPTQVLIGDSGSGGYELITYYGPDGQTVNIPFFNDMPLGLIPPGYTRTAPQVAASDQAVRETEGRAANIELDTDRTPIDQMNANQVAESYNSTFNIDPKTGKFGVAAASILGGPIVGLLARGVTAINANQREALEKQAELIGLNLASVKDPYNLSRENFKDEEAFSDAMQSVAPEGMTYDSSIRTTVTNDDGSTSEVTGGYTREGTTPVTKSLRPRARPGSDTTETSNSSKGLGQSVAEALGFDSAKDMFDGGGRGASAADTQDTDDDNKD